MWYILMRNDNNKKLVWGEKYQKHILIYRRVLKYRLGAFKQMGGWK